MKKPVLILILLLPVAACSARKKNFVDIQTLDPTIKVEARYFGKYNFVGSPIEGYKAPKCLLTRQAAEALTKVQKELQQRGLSLKAYDCYRPQRGVNHFVRWAKDLSDTKMKSVFYPDVKKENLFGDGYIASRSGHSRGSTIDLTIEGFDMGSPYDFFDPISHTENPKITGKAGENRMLLKSIMEKHDFENYTKEWWHYTLKNEPFPNRYFDFEVE